MSAPSTRQWTRAEYDRLIDLGISTPAPASPTTGFVNLREAVIEVYREPARSPRSRYGWRYGRIERLGPEAVIFPLATPRSRVRVKSLLP